MTALENDQTDHVYLEVYVPDDRAVLLRWDTSQRNPCTRASEDAQERPEHADERMDLAPAPSIYSRGGTQELSENEGTTATLAVHISLKPAGHRRICTV